jgi:protoporphyrinogen oxidase
VNKRTKQLVYIQEGFQTLVNHMEKVDTMRGVTILKGYTVESIKKRKEQFAVKYAKNGEKESTTDIFDAVISTLPTAIMSKVTDQLLPSHYLEQFSKLQYMHAVNLILETKEPILNKTYWLSNCVKEFPFLVVVQHTNMVDKLHYGGKHIAYIGNYLDADDPLLKMDKQQTLDIFLPELEKIAGKKIEVTQSFHFKAGFAQPIFDKVFVKNKPTFTTPVKNFFIANLDMTYPYDRGTNYAVKLGKQVASFI